MTGPLAGVKLAEPSGLGDPIRWVGVSHNGTRSRDACDDDWR